MSYVFGSSNGPTQIGSRMSKEALEKADAARNAAILGPGVKVTPLDRDKVPKQTCPFWCMYCTMKFSTYEEWKAHRSCPPPR